MKGLVCAKFVAPCVKWGKKITVFTHKYVWEQIKVQQNNHKYYDTLQKK